MTLKQYHDQTVYTGGLNCPYLRTSVVIASDAEAALTEKDAEIAALKKRVKELEEKPAKKTCDGCIHFEKRLVEWPCNECERVSDDNWEARG